MCTGRVVDTVVGGGALPMPSPFVVVDGDVLVEAVWNGLREPACCAGSADGEVVVLGCEVGGSVVVEEERLVCCG